MHESCRLLEVGFAARVLGLICTLHPILLPSVCMRQRYNTRTPDATKLDSHHTRSRITRCFYPFHLLLTARSPFPVLVPALSAYLQYNTSDRAFLHLPRVPKIQTSEAI